MSSHPPDQPPGVAIDHGPGEANACRFCGGVIGEGWGRAKRHLRNHEKVCAGKTERERKRYRERGRWTP